MIKQDSKTHLNETGKAKKIISNSLFHHFLVSLPVIRKIYKLKEKIHMLASLFLIKKTLPKNKMDSLPKSPSKWDSFPLSEPMSPCHAKPSIPTTIFLDTAKIHGIKNVHVVAVLVVRVV